MTEHRNSEQFTKASAVEYKIKDVLIRPNIRPPLLGCDLQIWELVEAQLKETKGFQTADITKRYSAKKKKETGQEGGTSGSWVRDKLEYLVGGGYICSYYDNGKIRWCCRKAAKNMVRKCPQLASNREPNEQEKEC